MLSYQSPKEFALSYLRPYVLRGDSLDYLTTCGGYSGGGYSLATGSMYIYNGDKMIYKSKHDELVVDEFEGVDCCHIFKVKNLRDEILNEKEQPLLFNF